MTDAELDRLERLYNDASPEPWEIHRTTDDGIERFSLAVVGAKIDTVCTLEEDEPGDFDEIAREGILANFAFILHQGSASRDTGAHC